MGKCSRSKASTRVARMSSVSPSGVPAGAPQSLSMVLTAAADHLCTDGADIHYLAPRNCTVARDPVIIGMPRTMNAICRPKSKRDHAMVPPAISKRTRCIEYFAANDA